MSKEVVDIIINRVKEYLDKNNGEKFQFIFHGGEPLLAPISWYEYFINKSNATFSNYNINYALQTNGVLYDEKLALNLNELGIAVGFSWDGPKEVHDKFRVKHNHDGSYEEVIRGIKLHKKLFGKVGGLSVINAEVSPLDYYENINQIGLDSVSQLLPHLHYEMKNEYNKFQYDSNTYTYGKWLVQLFDLWYYDNPTERPRMFFFEELIAMIIGYNIVSECFGNQELNAIIVETNGDIESSAALKSISDGYTKEGNNIKNCSFDDALKSDLIVLLNESHVNLCEKCNNCAIVEVCGGGRVNERYDKINKFNNPSIYCNDYKLIISHIQNRILENLSEQELSELNLKRLNYAEI